MEHGERVTTYFTFGQAHPFGNHYVTFVDTTIEDARIVMAEIFGRNWGFQYVESEWEGQVERYNYKELARIDTPDVFYEQYHRPIRFDDTRMVTDSDG